MLLCAACAAIAILGGRSTSAQRSPDAPFVPGELLVTFRRAATEGQRNGLRRAVGSRLLRRFEHFEVEHLKLPANVSVDQALRVLRGAGRAQRSTQLPDLRRRAGTPERSGAWLANSPPNLRGLQKINAQAA